MKRSTKFLIKCDLFLLLCCIFLTAANFISSPNAQIKRPSTAASHTKSIQPDSTANTAAYTSTSSDDNPSAADQNIQTEDTLDDSWYLILVNKWNYIPDDYEVELTELSNGQAVDSRIYPALQEMFDAARAEGLYPVVGSGYRTFDKQQSLLDDKIVWYESQGYSPEEAKEKAEAWVAIPGTSEHQLGISVDINADSFRSSSDEVYNWLNENSYKYGFIRRYPPDKTEITGVINEPWHYRYVGITDAAKIYQQGICLEEYLDAVHEQ